MSALHLDSCRDQAGRQGRGAPAQAWVPPSPAHGPAQPAKAAQGTAGVVPGRGRTNLRRAYIAGTCGSGAGIGSPAHAAETLAVACRLTGAGWSATIPLGSDSRSVAWDAALARCRTVLQGMDPSIDCLVLQPGWERTLGSLAERDLALQAGIRVLTLTEALANECVARRDRKLQQGQNSGLRVGK